MTWAGQHVLRTCAPKFSAPAPPATGYYTEHEAGDLMSRITNDTETIQQALNFALVNVASGVLLLVWIGYNMLRKAWRLPAEHGGGAAHGSGDLLVFHPGAQGLPQDAHRDGQCQRRAAREHLSGA
jgi:ABC-type multidrug transport system fused ATPase/permease subunit